MRSATAMSAGSLLNGDPAEGTAALTEQWTDEEAGTKPR